MTPLLGWVLSYVQLRTMENRTMEYRTMEYMEFLMEYHGVWRSMTESDGERIRVIWDARECRVCRSQGLGEKGVLWHPLLILLPLLLQGRRHDNPAPAPAPVHFEEIAVQYAALPHVCFFFFNIKLIYFNHLDCSSATSTITSTCSSAIWWPC